MSRIREVASTVDVKKTVAEQVQRMVTEGLPIVPPEMDGCHIEVQTVTALISLVRVRTPQGVRYFEVKVSEKI